MSEEHNYSLRGNSPPTIQALEEKVERADTDFLQTIHAAAVSVGQDVRSAWELIKVAAREVKTSAKTLQERYIKSGQASNADKMYKLRLDTVDASKKVRQELQSKLPLLDTHNLTMISEVSEARDERSVRPRDVMLHEHREPPTAPTEDPRAEGATAVLGTDAHDPRPSAKPADTTPPPTPAHKEDKDKHVEISVRTKRGIHNSLRGDRLEDFTIRSSAHSPSPFTSTPMRHSTPKHSPDASAAPAARVCDGGYKRAEAEFLRGPRENSMKFGDGNDNYHMWAEAFEHGLSLLPDLTDINKLHSLVAHTKGEARDVVLEYKNSTRPGNAKVLFEKAWNNLRTLYGSEDILADNLDAKVRAFKPLSYPLVINQLSKFIALCECVQASYEGEDVRDRILRKYDEKDGLHILASKLPRVYLERWQDEVLEYRRVNGNEVPNLWVFLEFLDWLFRRVSDPFLRDLEVEEAKASTDIKPCTGTKQSSSTKPKRAYAGATANPSGFAYTNSAKSTRQNANSPRYRSSRPGAGHNKGFFCPIHQTTGHKLLQCPDFLNANTEQRRILLERGYACLKCTYAHPTWKCDATNLKCGKCQGSHLTYLHDLHVTPLHTTPSTHAVSPSTTPAGAGAGAGASAGSGVTATPGIPAPVVRTHVAHLCLQTCVNERKKVAFSKTQLILLRHVSDVTRTIKCLVMVDEKSRHTFVDEKVVNLLKVRAPSCSYQLETLAGLSTTVHGSMVQGLQVRGHRMDTWHNVPMALTGGHLPDSRAERATRQIVESIPMLAQYAPYFDDEDRVPETLLLIGTNMQEAFKVTSYGDAAPYAHLNIFGWSVVGEVDEDLIPSGCLAADPHALDAARSYRGSIVRDIICAAAPRFLQSHEGWNPAADAFEERRDDDELAYSQDEREFLQIMLDGICRVEDGRIQLPLPVKARADKVPRNEGAVYHRNLATLQRAAKDPVTLTRLCEAMQKHLDMGHVAKTAPNAHALWTVPEWFLPLVLVHQVHKQSIRITIDGSARCKGCSLNDLLHSGPDLNNTLRGVLHRLRVHKVAITLDLRHMFNCFVVPEEHRGMLQFHWWEDNNPNKPLVAYHYTVHPFGACSSPSVAMFALKSIAYIGRSTGELSVDEANFIENSFYMDDGTDSLPDAETAIKLIDAVKKYLKKFGLIVHKINSNNGQVKNAFDSGEAHESIVSIDKNLTPKTLGVAWNTTTDVVSVRLKIPTRPFTRRGVLATVNTIFDPLGMAAPVILGGRQFQRELLKHHPVKQPSDWDTPLSERHAPEWKRWVEEVTSMETIDIARCLCPYDSPINIEMHCFADASEVAIACVMYLKVTNEANETSVTFVTACSKLAPQSASSSIPRLELCAALLAALMCFAVCKDLRINITSIFLYTDSQVVLGYLRNTTKQFTKYVSRRVEAILRVFPISHWRFVSTLENPADIGTRPCSPKALIESIWLSGPKFLFTGYIEPSITVKDTLPETLPQVAVLRATCTFINVLVVLAKRISSWSRLVRAVTLILQRLRHVLDSVRQRKSISLAPRGDLSARQDAISLLFKASQQESFSDVIQCADGNCVAVHDNLPDRHPLSGMSPIIVNGMLRVGGRLRQLASPFEIKHPIILDSKNCITELFAKFCHDLSPHQGRVITMNKIRSMGVFIIGGRKLVNKIIQNCVQCKRLRGSTCEQVMADLPSCRLSDTAPFDHVGVDVAGPFYVHDGATTRRTKGTKKVFVLVINCLSSRAIHLEALGGMDTNSFINALRRFIAVRGTCSSILSDHGTNFIGALSQSEDLTKVKSGVEGLGIQWRLNPVGASHFGGAYERKIGSIRRVLEALLLPRNASVNRDDFLTLLQEAACVVNSTPLFPGPDGPGEPLAVSPSCLLTLKTPGASPLPEEFTEADQQAYGKRRWRRTQWLASCFWKQWQENYLQNLQRRQKWRKETPNMRVNDVVILRTKNTPRCHWPLAVVRHAVPGVDGKVRRVTVAISDANGRVRETERTVNDLILLFTQ